MKLKGHKQQRGFTLMELMITVAIIGLLGAIAYPSYVDNVKRSARSEALVVLQDIGATIETYKLTNNITSYNDLPNLATLYSFTTEIEDRYTFAEPTTTATTWKVTATPKGPQSGDGPLILYSDGRKGWDSDSNGVYEPVDN